jgi:hypothetical protein
MPLSAMRERWRAKSGGGGTNQSHKQEQNQNQNQKQKQKQNQKQNQKLMKHSLLNKTKNKNFGTKMQCGHHNSLHQKHSLLICSSSKCER